MADGRAGVFLFAHGPVSVQAGGMASAVVRGTVVHEGDVVETGPGGRAQLRMVDGAMIDLEPGSTLRLAEYQLAAQPANHRSLLELVRGGLRTLTGVIGQQNQPGYELRVRTVTIGVRGTEYRTELQGEQVVLDVLQGRVALCNPAGCVDVARGESARAPLSGALPARTAAATVPGGAAAGEAGGEQIAPGRRFPVQHFAGEEHARHGLRLQAVVQDFQTNAACGADRFGHRPRAAHLQRQAFDGVRDARGVGHCFARQHVI